MILICKIDYLPLNANKPAFLDGTNGSFKLLANAGIKIRFLV